MFLHLLYEYINNTCQTVVPFLQVYKWYLNSDQRKLRILAMVT